MTKRTLAGFPRHDRFPSPLSGLPALPELRRRATAPRTVLDDAACFALWDKYEMLPHIRQHSLRVAQVATVLARRAVDMGLDVNVAETRMSALLHDIAKTYCVRYGGSHAPLGASWVVRETGNRAVAQGVMLHVWWPWPVPRGPEICALPFFVLYADKRVRHDECVTLEERYEDLLARYGATARARAGICASYRQGKLLERALEAQLACRLHDKGFAHDDDVSVREGRE